MNGSDIGQAGLSDANLSHSSFSPDGRTVTNENGQQYLRDEELAIVTDRLQVLP